MLWLELRPPTAPGVRGQCLRRCACARSISPSCASLTLQLLGSPSSRSRDAPARALPAVGTTMVVAESVSKVKIKSNQTHSFPNRNQRCPKPKASGSVSLHFRGVFPRCPRSLIGTRVGGATPVLCPPGPPPVYRAADEAPGRLRPGPAAAGWAGAGRPLTGRARRGRRVPWALRGAEAGGPFSGLEERRPAGRRSSSCGRNRAASERQLWRLTPVSAGSVSPRSCGSRECR